MDALRLQKSHHLIPRKMSIEYLAFESGQGRFNRLGQDADARGAGATDAGPGANRVA